MDLYFKAQRLAYFFIYACSINDNFSSSVYEKLFISSKFKPNLLDECEAKDYYKVLKENILLSFKRMNIEYLDAYLLHSSRYVFNEAIMDALYTLKKEGLAGKVGVSVYEVDEAKKCIDNPKADFMLTRQKISHM